MVLILLRFMPLRRYDAASLRCYPPPYAIYAIILRHAAAADIDAAIRAMPPCRCRRDAFRHAICYAFS